VQTVCEKIVASARFTKHAAGVWAQPRSRVRWIGRTVGCVVLRVGRSVRHTMDDH